MSGSPTGDPVFVCGLARSGTTWIAKSLGQSPDLTYVEEAWLIGRLAELTDWFDQLQDEGWSGFTPWRRAGIDRPAFISRVAGFYGDLLALAAGGGRYVEKTPNENAVHLRLLHELFPNAYYVLVHRDGRDCVASLEAMKEHQGEAFDFDAACRRWAATMDLFDGVRREGSIRRLTSIRYEDLLADFGAVFRDLCAFTGIEPFAPVPYAPNSAFADLGRPGSFTSRWHGWSERRRDAFKRHAGSQLIAAGYADSDDW